MVSCATLQNGQAALDIALSKRSNCTWSCVVLMASGEGGCFASACSLLSLEGVPVCTALGAPFSASEHSGDFCHWTALILQVSQHWLQVTARSKGKKGESLHGRLCCPFPLRKWTQHPQIAPTKNHRRNS